MVMPWSSGIVAVIAFCPYLVEVIYRHSKN